MKTCGRGGNRDMYGRRRRGRAGLRPFRRFPRLYHDANQDSGESEGSGKSGGATIICGVREGPLLATQNQEGKDSISVIGGGGVRGELEGRGKRLSAPMARPPAAGLRRPSLPTQPEPGSRSSDANTELNQT